MIPNPDTVRHRLQRLVEDASAIAPSIRLFDTDGNYGRVDDRELDRQRVITFELGAQALLEELAQYPDRVFTQLTDLYAALKEESKRLHSRSIWVHKTQQLLRSALELLERHLADLQRVYPTAADEALVRPVLKLLYERSLVTHEPSVVTALTAECGLSEAQAQLAWRHLRERAWIETFQLPYAARLNAAGWAAAAEIEQAGTRPGDVEPAYGLPMPPLPEHLRPTLQALWLLSAARNRVVDAPTFLDDHPQWRAALEELLNRRLISRDSDAYRLTPLGLLSLEDKAARVIIVLGGRLRGVLRTHFRNEQTRAQFLSTESLATQLGVDYAHLSFAMAHLWDALIRWCVEIRGTLVEPLAVRPRERILQTSLMDVAREPAEFPARNGGDRPARTEPATPMNSLPEPSSSMTTTPPAPSPSAPPASVAMISYSHDTTGHKDWVRVLADRLTRDGIDVVLDQWHLQLGDDLPRFMEESIASADFVLLICTEIYVSKADARAGGAGSETRLLAAQLLTPEQIAAKGPSRIIPIVRQSSSPRRLPRFAAGRLLRGSVRGCARCRGCL